MRPLSLASCLLGSALLAVGLCPTATYGQFPNRSAPQFYPNVNETADAMLRNARSHARDQQWTEAIEIYQRVIQQYGERVARLPREEGEDAGDSTLYVDVRQFCQRKIAELPAEARKLYQSRVDVQAERWFRQGAEDRDRTLLRRVIEQAFCSSWGDDAENLMADLAFQDGRFEEALAAYRTLVPDRPGDKSALVHPDPSVDLAQIAAKKLLCRAAIGDDPPGKADLDAFRAAYPDAKGELAGREGLYAETLAEALERDQLAPPAQPDGRWPTFAGAPTRTRIMPGGVDVGSLQWRVDLDPIVPRQGQRFVRGAFIGGPPRADKLLAYHPIVLGDQVVYCDDSQIVAYNLNDRPETSPVGKPGAIKVAWRQNEAQGGGVPQAARPSIGLPRYTLTAFGDRIYARMGLTSTAIGSRGSPSYIVAVDRATDGKLIWKKPSSEIGLPNRRNDVPSRSLGFEGSPVADGRHVYVALTERREMTETFVACLDAETGAVRWVRVLGSASGDENNQFPMGGMPMGMNGIPSNDFGHRLLTLDGPTLYYQTNLGAVIALDAESGSIRWLATYPRVDRTPGTPGSRDLNPAIVHDGLVIVAPDDASAIFAFEANTGRLAWKSEPIPDEVRLTHLLGVARGRLVATGDRVMLFDVKTGKLIHSWPDNGTGYEGYGRGLLAGDKIYWPTRTEIHVLDQATGLRSETPIKLQESFQESGGNLVLGDGFLIVSQSDKLVVFCQNRRLIQRYQEEIARNPDQSSAYFRMAQAAEATNQDELALGSFGEAQARARASEMIDGVPMLDATRDHRYRLLIKLGLKSRSDQKPRTAAERFREAAGTARSDRDRLRARLLESEAQAADDQPREAISTLQNLLAEERLRSVSVVVEEGRRSIRADLLIADRLGEIVRKHGRPLYLAYDERAVDLLRKGQKSEDPAILEQVSRSFPVARVAAESLLSLGRVLEAKGRPQEAVRAYKRLLGTAEDDSTRAQALVGMARAYEAEGHVLSAREALTQVVARFPNTKIEVEESGGPAPTLVSSYVTSRLTAPPYAQFSIDGLEPSLPVPLGRRWEKVLAAPVRPLAAEGLAPTPHAGRIFLAQGDALRPVDARTGEAAWTAELGSTPLWVGFLGDRVLAATDRKVVALGLEKGEAAWTYEPVAAPAPKAAGPFAPPEPQAAGRDESPASLSGFRIVGDRVFLLKGTQELVAIDGDTGQVDWSFAPPHTTINPQLLVGPERIVLQILKSAAGHTKPESLIVLDTTNGRRRSEYPQDGDEAWPRPPLALDDQNVILVVDRRTVSRFDLTRGSTSWLFRESKELPRYAPPRPIGDVENLLVVQDGSELIRLDAVTGEKRWSRPLGTKGQDERVPTLAVDAQRVYWINGRTLSGARLSDGSIAWTRQLLGPESGWALELTEGCLAAYPGVPRGADEPLDSFVLTLCLRSNGALLQRLLFAAPVREVALKLASGDTLVATQSAVWSLGARTSAGTEGRPPR